MSGSPGPQVTRRQSIADRSITMMTAPWPIPCSLGSLAQAPVRNAGSTAAGKNSAGRDDPIALLRTANAERMPRCCGVDAGL